MRSGSASLGGHRVTCLLLAQSRTLQTYKRFRHGMPTTRAKTINADLLAFLHLTDSAAGPRMRPCRPVYSRSTGSHPGIEVRALAPLAPVRFPEGQRGPGTGRMRASRRNLSRLPHWTNGDILPS